MDPYTLLTEKTWEYQIVKGDRSDKDTNPFLLAQEFCSHTAEMMEVCRKYTTLAHAELLGLKRSLLKVEAPSQFIEPVTKAIEMLEHSGACPLKEVKK